MKYLTETYRITNLLMIEYAEVKLKLTNILQGTMSKIHAQFRELGHARLVREHRTLWIIQMFQGFSIKKTLYKLTFVSELTEDDPGPKKDFCKRIINKLNRTEIKWIGQTGTIE